MGLTGALKDNNINDNYWDYDASNGKYEVTWGAHGYEQYDNNDHDDNDQGDYHVEDMENDGVDESFRNCNNGHDDDKDDGNDQFKVPL